MSYQVADAFEYGMSCHCSQGRRSTGSAFKPLAGIGASRLALTTAGDALMCHGDEQGHDAHCRVCGSLLYSAVRDGRYVHVALGTLVDEPSIRPTMHIFAGQAGEQARGAGRDAGPGRDNSLVQDEATSC